MRTLRLFMSYAAVDRRAAEDLWSNLRQALGPSRSFRCELWAFTEALVVGQEWDSEIRMALDNADIGVCALSNAFLSSEYIRRVELPMMLHPADPHKRIAPVLLKKLTTNADLLGIEDRQIFGFRDPYWAGKPSHRRAEWAVDLADDLHRLASRYGLGT